MADKLSPSRRSANMAAIRAKDTAPELIVRRLIHSLGYRYRLHAADLPGKPDLVFRSRRKVIFVHGCFWHLHPDEKCLDARRPKTNKRYWGPKLTRNAERDAQHVAVLKSAGWKVLIIWECETKKRTTLEKRLVKFLGRREGENDSAKHKTRGPGD